MVKMSTEANSVYNFQKMERVAFLGLTAHERWPLFLRLSGDEYTVELSRYPAPGDRLVKREVLIDDRLGEMMLMWSWPSDVCMERSQYQLITRGIHLGVVIYCVNYRRSFMDARKILEDIAKKSRFPDVPKILVGYSQEDIEDNRQVSRDEGETAAQEYSCPFVEVSLMNDDDIERLLVMMGRIARERARECSK